MADNTRKSMASLKTNSVDEALWDDDFGSGDLDSKVDEQAVTVTTAPGKGWKGEGLQEGLKGGTQTQGGCCW